MPPVAGEAPRRWFASAEEDLIVWLDADGSIRGFQFCYERSGQEKVLAWHAGGGFSHCFMDTGERDGLTYKRQPVISTTPVPGPVALAARFRAIAGALPGEIAAFVSGKLVECEREVQ